MKRENRRRYSFLAVALLLLLIVGCDEETIYSPKPKSYFAIQLPQRGDFQVFSSPDCPYKFTYPGYARVDRDTAFFDEALKDQCWVDVVLPSLSGKIHLSYKQIGGENTFEKLVNDVYTMTYKHTVKASYIDDPKILTPKGVSGVRFEVGGDAASNMQFYLSDTTNHFLRGALYFGTSPNEDSLRPVIKFVREDLDQLINSFEWAE